MSLKKFHERVEKLLTEMTTIRRKETITTYKKISYILSKGKSRYTQLNGWEITYKQAKDIEDEDDEDGEDGDDENIETPENIEEPNDEDVSVINDDDYVLENISKATYTGYTILHSLMACGEIDLQTASKSLIKYLRNDKEITNNITNPKRIIYDKCPIRIQKDRNVTPIHVAAYNGNHELLKILNDNNITFSDEIQEKTIK